MIAGARLGGAGLVVGLAVLAFAWLGGAKAGAAAPSHPDAVLLVSGFNTETPFTTPDPFCDGQGGPEWNPPTGPAAALKAAGHDVFTAPVRRKRDPILAPCPAVGSPLPPLSAYIDSNADIDANGAALAELIGFLRDEYGVERLQVLAHSAGGLWARSAITQNGAYEGLEIRSLTTLGTPHTGSFLADLAIALQDSKCDLPNRTEQALCKGLRDLADLIALELGEAATRELTNDFLATWNPQQRLGSCRVTGIAGTFVDLPLPVSRYYDPADGEVGEASALAERSHDIELHPIPAPGIPNFHVGGTFPVVHSGAVKALSPNNLINTQAISDRVVEIIGAIPPTGPLCNEASSIQASATGKEEADVVRTRLPLNLLAAPSPSGRLPNPGAEDVVVLRRGVRARCDGRSKLDVARLFGDRRLRVVYPTGCEGQLRVSKRQKGARDATQSARRPQALLVRSHPRNDILLKKSGDRVRIRLRGPRVERLRARVRTTGRWRRLELDQAGRGKLPKGGGRADLRIRAQTGRGLKLATASAVLSR